MGGLFYHVNKAQYRINTKHTNAKIIPIIRKTLKIDANTVPTTKYNCQFCIPSNIEGLLETIEVTLYAKYINDITKT